MSTSKKNTFKVEQYNVLLLGYRQKLDFIKNCVLYCKHILDNNAFPKNIIVNNSTFGFTRNYFNVFDKRFCFIDTTISFNVQCLYNVIRNLDVHAIIIFTDKYLLRIEWYLKTFFTASNFPSENVIFVAICRDQCNTLVTSVNLQMKLKEFQINFETSLNKNLFLVRDIGDCTLAFPKEFCERLERLSSLQPCVQQFSVDIPLLFNIIADLFPSLIEVLHFIEYQLIEDQQKHLVIGETRFTLCTLCYFKENIKCHDDCICFNKTSEELENCQVFDGDMCQECSCSVKDHVTTRHFLADNETNGTHLDLVFEKNTILHFLASLYLFCKLRHGLPEVCKNYNEEYWSLGKRGKVISQEPIYKELENKIAELDSSCKPSAEEVTQLIEQFYEQEWHSFLMTEYLQTKCQLKFMKSASRSKQQVANVQRPLKFPEMKTKAACSARGENAGDVALHNLKMELLDLKISTDKEKKCMQEQINDLKRQIKQNKTTL